MKKRSALLVGIPITAVIAGVVAILLWPSPARTITISVSAPIGTKVTGNYRVDGVESLVDTEAPAQFVVTGRDVRCSIRKDEQPGEMSVRIATDDGWASATAGPGGGVKAGYRSGNGLTKSEGWWATNTQAEP